MQAACRDLVGFFVLPCTVPLFTSCFYPTESPLPGAGAEAPPGQLWGRSCSRGGSVKNVFATEKITRKL